MFPQSIKTGVIACSWIWLLPLENSPQAGLLRWRCGVRPCLLFSITMPTDKIAPRYQITAVTHSREVHFFFPFVSALKLRATNILHIFPGYCEQHGVPSVPQSRGRSGEAEKKVEKQREKEKKQGERDRGYATRLFPTVFSASCKKSTRKRRQPLLW